ncbi:hypothetical protein COCVIDRAFT_19917 [Bipolaris victoriae FI3]|uniref:Uncharacterized protein n=1 Tax=Bipolaris victoriae (strain FI3) TaxID=930091 RepID=W7E8U2_BIPV3|nr:hypothetical protein COCVIDRAFT_19917 [Bipolaris victoriae FI3]
MHASFCPCPASPPLQSLSSLCYFITVVTALSPITAIAPSTSSSSWPNVCFWVAAAPLQRHAPRACHNPFVSTVTHDTSHTPFLSYQTPVYIAPSSRHALSRATSPPVRQMDQGHIKQSNGTIKALPRQPLAQQLGLLSDSLSQSRRRHWRT